MRTLLLFLLLSVTTMTFAQTTIKTTISKNRHFAAGSMEKLFGSKSFPYKHYEINEISTMQINGIPSDDKKLKDKYDAVLLKANLDLISYDKAHDTYKFNLSFKPEIGLINTKANSSDKDYKEMAVEIVFAGTNQESIILEGQFTHNDKNANPKINESDTKPFMLSINDLNEITLSTQHDVQLMAISK